jgi:parvulin-like peptidyl-prolyl isomerase
MTMSKGQVSDIVTFYNSFYLIKCIEKKDLGYTSFDDAKAGIKSKVISQKYDEMIEKSVKEDKVNVNQSIYGKIFIR